MLCDAFGVGKAVVPLRLNRTCRLAVSVRQRRSATQPRLAAQRLPGAGRFALRMVGLARRHVAVHFIQLNKHEIRKREIRNSFAISITAVHPD